MGTSRLRSVFQLAVSTAKLVAQVALEVAVNTLKPLPYRPEELGAAILSGDVAGFRAILTAMPQLANRSIDARDNRPIHLAAQHGPEEIVSALLEKGAETNVRNRDYLLPVSVALQNGQYPHIWLIAEKEADRPPDERSVRDSAFQSALQKTLGTLSGIVAADVIALCQFAGLPCRASRHGGRVIQA